VERFSEVSGKPVVCVETGEEAGIVEAVVCRRENRVSGFLVDIGTIGKKYGFILIEDVLESDSETVKIFNRECILKNRDKVKAYRKNRGWNGLNKKVVTNDGELLGTVKDGVFDTDSGTIAEIELSLGVVEDLRDGRRRFSIGEDTEFSEEIIILKNGGKEQW